MVWDISHANAGSFRWFDIGTRSSLERRKADGTTRREFAWAAIGRFCGEFAYHKFATR